MFVSKRFFFFDTVFPPPIVYFNILFAVTTIHFHVFIAITGAPGVGGNPQHSGRPRPSHNFSGPCGTPPLRYPPFFFRPHPVPLSRSMGHHALVATSDVLDPPPGGAQSLRFSFPPRLLRISALLLYSQPPAQYSLA